MSNYSKLIAAIAGNVVALLVVYLTTKGLVTCTSVTDPNSCTVLGMTTGQLNGAVMFILNAAFVHFAPANKPPVAS